MNRFADRHWPNLSKATKAESTSKNGSDKKGTVEVEWDDSKWVDETDKKRTVPLSWIEPEDAVTLEDYVDQMRTTLKAEEERQMYEQQAITKDPRAQVLDEAKSAVMSDRNAHYGPPEDNFRDIAELWNAWLTIRFPSSRFNAVKLTSLDVAQMMIQVKQARMLTSPTVADHHTDIAGYAACGYAAALRP